jgi:hypothetical protein
VRDALSLWRSPLDQVALREARALRDRQPHCQLPYYEDLSQMTIYNYENYIYNNGNPQSPDSALTAMLNAMKTNRWGNYGGVAFIPQKSYAVDAYATTGHSVPPQCNLVASGTGGTPSGQNPPPNFFHFTITPAGAPYPSYFLYCSAGHTSGGQFFRGLAFQWETTSIIGDTCIYANTWNCRAIDCNFLNCPVAFDAQALSCGLEQCTIQYNSGPNGGGASGAGAFAAVVLQGSQCFAVGPGEFLQQSQAQGGPQKTCCISFQYGLEHGIVQDLHISHWSYGITYAISSDYTINHCMVTNVEFSCWETCVYMQPSSSNGKIYDQKYTSCTFTIDTDTPDMGSLVYIDPAGGSVNDVRFIGCTAYQSRGHGYEIRGGSNIEIIGGTSSGNGTTGGAGIAITGNCGSCAFIGVNLDASYPDADLGFSQAWAFLCTSSPSEQILLDGCSMQGYPSNPISVSGSPAALLIRNCPGYNDQNTPILAGIANLPAGMALSAATVGNHVTGATNYYGPSLVVFTAGGTGLTFTINGSSIAWSVPASGFVTYYVASPYDTIEFSNLPAHFTWLGK